MAAEINRCRVWQTGRQVPNFNATAAMAALMDADMLGRFYNLNRHMNVSGTNNPERYTCYHKCLHSLQPCQRNPAMKKYILFRKCTTRHKQLAECSSFLCFPCSLARIAIAHCVLEFCSRDSNHVVKPGSILTEEAPMIALFWSIIRLQITLI